MKAVEKVKYFSGIIISPELRLQTVIAELERAIGPLDFVSEKLDFDYTGYYSEEMGEGLQRVFVSFSEPDDPAILADMKIKSAAVENLFSERGSRKVNLDPGYIEPSKVVLASTKNFYHRIYLKNGIYAEITLSWKERRYRFFEWTFPDFRSEEYMKILKGIRKTYMEQRKAGLT